MDCEILYIPCPSQDLVFHLLLLLCHSFEMFSLLQRNAIWTRSGSSACNYQRLETSQGFFACYPGAYSLHRNQYEEKHLSCKKCVCAHRQCNLSLFLSFSLLSFFLSLSLSLSLSLCLSVSRPVGIPRACSRNKDKRILALVRRRCPARIWNRARTGHELFTDQGRL